MELREVQPGHDSAFLPHGVAANAMGLLLRNRIGRIPCAASPPPACRPPLEGAGLKS